MRVCSEPGCPELVVKGKCPEHKRERWRKTNAKRPSSRAQGYDAKWQRTARAHRKAFPICQWQGGCIRPSEQTHHLDGLGPKGLKGHDWSNLQSLCANHHSQITGKQHGFGATERPGGCNAKA